MTFLLATLILGIIFAVIDVVWLKSARGFYEKEIGSLLLKRPNMPAAIAFYVIYIMGVTFLVVYPAFMQEGSHHLMVAVNAAVVGLLTYATYDLTNMATLKNWSYRVVIIDMAWGVFVTTVASLIAYSILEVWL